MLCSSLIYCNKILGLKYMEYMEFIQIPDNVLTLGTQVKLCLHVTPNIAYILTWEANHIERVSEVN